MVGAGGGAADMRVTALPGNVSPAAQALARAAGWQLEFAPPGAGSDADAALVARAEGRPVLFVPQGARVARKIRRIVVLHEGSPAVAPGLAVADEAALVTGASVVVLHVAEARTPPEAGSLPIPSFVDHDHHDWSEWRREFIRRFCDTAESPDVSLDVVTGEVVPALLARARELRANLLVVTWKGDPSAGRAGTARAVLGAAECPVLLVREEGATARPQVGKGRRMILRPPGGRPPAP
jgi:nucleotide-binding universal stress UspA family protein